ncbi:glycosyltransferase family 4 protein [Candidatus Microgenomates bacterium]|nr:glycosyltransferase family 4 protein [Candidatus Microgenomates bacterium]
MGKNKIIGVDAGCLGVKDKRLKVGVYQVAFNLLKELGKLDKANEYRLYSFYPIEEKLMRLMGERMKNIVLKPRKGWFSIRLPLELKLNPVDIFLGLSQALPHSLSHNILMVYDLAFEHYPQFYLDSYKSLSKNTKTALKLAHKIITISQSTKRDLVELYRVQEKRIEACYLGVSKDFNPKGKKFKSGVPYFLFVGALKKNKNIPQILKGFNYFLAKSSKKFNLILVGGDLWLDAEITKTIKELKLTDKIITTGFINNQDLLEYYRGATAFVSPSLYEGGGLTHLEAMACGIPVIAGNVSSMPELVGSAGILVDPKSEEKIGRAMLKIVNDKEFKNDLIKKGLVQAKKFSWQKFAENVLEIINY